MWCHSNPLFLKNSKKNIGPSSTALFDCRAGYQRLRSAGNGKLAYSEEYMRSQTLLKPLARVAAMILIMAGLAYGAESNRDSMPLAKATFAGGCFWCMEPP